MEHKDIWLVLGLTVILAVAVSLSTVSLTGDAIWGKTVSKTPATSSQSCKIIDTRDNTMVGKSMNDVCKGMGMTCSGVVSESRYAYLDSNGKTQMTDFFTRLEGVVNCNALLETSGTNGPAQLNSANMYAEPYAGKMEYSTYFSAVLCCK